MKVVMPDPGSSPGQARSGIHPGVPRWIAGRARNDSKVQCLLSAMAVMILSVYAIAMADSRNVATVAVDQHRPGGADGILKQRLGSRQHVPDQRLAAERLQNLGQGRAHALALPGGQDDDL